VGPLSVSNHQPSFTQSSQPQDTLGPILSVVSAALIILCLVRRAKTTEQLTCFCEIAFQILQTDIESIKLHPINNERIQDDNSLPTNGSAYEYILESALQRLHSTNTQISKCQKWLIIQRVQQIPLRTKDPRTFFHRSPRGQARRSIQWLWQMTLKNGWR